MDQSRRKARLRKSMEQLHLCVPYFCHYSMPSLSLSVSPIEQLLASLSYALRLFHVFPPPASLSHIYGIAQDKQGIVEALETVVTPHYYRHEPQT